MADNKPKVITSRQAKKQINTFGVSLVIYSALLMLMAHGVYYISGHYPQIFLGYDPDIISMAAEIVLMILITTICFNLSAHMLRLDIHDYLGSPHLRIDRVIALICIGVGISLITTSISTLFYFFFHSQASDYPFLGSFNTPQNIIKNILYFILFVIVKPLCDEYIFRGIIQRQLGHYGRYFGVLGSAFLYAIVQTNLSEAIPSFFIGWYLALITLRYHSIRPSRWVHMAIAFLMWLINVLPGNLIWVTSVFIILIYVFSGLFIFQKRVDTSMVRYGATEGKLWKILLTSSTTVICMFLFVANIILSFS